MVVFMLTMASKKAAAAPKTVSNQIPKLVAGLYPLSNLRSVVSSLVEAGRVAKLTFAHSWAVAHMPIFSPEALRIIDVLVAPDKELPVDHFRLTLKRSHKE